MSDETTEIRALTRSDSHDDLMWSAEGFAHAQRLAKMFSESSLVPDHLRGKVADVTIALLMSKRLREDPLIVMQNMHSVKGKAGWNAQYVIARANKSGVFKGRIGYRETGTPGADDYAVTAFAVLADTGEEVSFTASMAMAKAEGWTSNPKYKSMPQVMLRYRAATFLVRFHAPDVMLGASTVEEIEDVVAAEPLQVESRLPRGKAALGITQDAELPDVIDAIVAEPAREVVEVKPAKTEKPKARPTLELGPGDDEAPL